MPSHELYLLHLGLLGDPNPTTGDIAWSQVPGYLIRTARGRNILVDTGNPLATIGAETAKPWNDLHMDVRPEDDVVARLAQLDLKPENIDLLVSTHFDWDHCGRHDAFAAVGTESVVQRNQMDAARDDPRYFPDLWDIPGLRYTLLDGETELEPGLTLLDTPGHAHGHQSVLVDTDAGSVLLAIDAISRRANLVAATAPDWYTNPPQAVRTIARLATLAETSGAYLIFGHDAQQWNTLPHSPARFQRP